MNIKTAIEKGTSFLKNKGIESARFDTELLLSHVLNIPRISLYIEFDRPLSEDETVRSRELLVRRSAGYPVAYALGHRGFYKNDFDVEPGVLIPRPETELLVEAALERLGDGKILHDWGCGSGCLGLSIAAERPDVELVAMDASEKAVEMTARNAEKLGLSGRVKVILQNVEGIQSETAPDMIVANPPYIRDGDPALNDDVFKYEPREALLSDQQGLGHHLRWAQKASTLLGESSFYLCEIGYDQGARLKSEFSKWFAGVEVHKDLAGHDRMIVARK